MKQYKFYVVWEGNEKGIFSSWEECKKSIEGFNGAKYKSFPSKEEATKAYDEGYKNYLYPKYHDRGNKILSPTRTEFSQDAIAVDASCMGNPGLMEYRGVYLKTGKELFRVGPLDGGTNNIGEFLAIVHALALLETHPANVVIYSDSVNAQLWVKNKKCKTTLKPKPKNKPIFDLIARAENWLSTHTYNTPIYKWRTEIWGEIPADFGRK
ncbi:MAG TPA: ribonuclease H [Porphyromonadaceae bacterium]|nr:ribonuclease H [Porphyromonadaceae bacterium]